MQSSLEKMRYLYKHTKSLGIAQLIEARRIVLWLPMSHISWFLPEGIFYSVVSSENSCPGVFIAAWCPLAQRLGIRSTTNKSFLHWREENE